MPKTYATIAGVSGYLPDYILTNEELEKMVDTNDAWITSRTGIKERRILKGGRATSDMGVEAVKSLLEKTGLKAEEIDLLICATVTADMKFPDTATLICHKVGAKKAFGFDINAACSGFLFTLFTAAKYIESGTYKNVVVVGADMMSSIIDYTDRATCILFGDGAGAVLLQPSRKYGIKDAVLHSDGSGADFLRMKAGGSRYPSTIETVTNKEHVIWQDGQPVFKAAVKGMTESVKEVMRRNDLTHTDVNWVVPHQANMRIINTVSSMLDFPMERVMVTIQKYGNTTAATIPLCLWDYEKQLKKGDKLILTAFGGGFTWGAIYLTWGY
jgi:3-oxoacyl-[acyl-carrier-protein] synthase III